MIPTCANRSHRPRRARIPAILLALLLGIGTQTSSANPLPGDDVPTPGFFSSSRVFPSPRFFLGGDWNGRAASYPAPPSPGGETVHVEATTSTASVLLESRRFPDPVAHAPGKSGPEARRSYGSGEIRFPWLYLAAGRRYLPGPRTAFLGHPGMMVAPGDLPAGRSVGSAFLHLPAAAYLPGVFTLEDTPGAGIYLTDPEQSFLLAYHPAARVGAFAAASFLDTDAGRLSWVADLRHVSRTTEGFARLRLAPLQRFQYEPDENGPDSPPDETDSSSARHSSESGASTSEPSSTFGFLIEGERRELWDYRDFEADEIFPGRRGKSGLGFIRLGVQPLGLEAAGQDVGEDGMRLLRLKGEWPWHNPGTSLRGALRWDLGGYRRRKYGGDDALEYRDRFAGLGLGFSARTFFLNLRAERRESGIVVGEVAAGLRAGAYRFELAGVFREGLPRSSPERDARRVTLDFLFPDQSPAWHTIAAEADQKTNHSQQAFLFQKTAGRGESGARFYRDESAVVRLRLQGPGLRLLLISSVTGGRPRIFGQLGVHIPLF